MVNSINGMTSVKLSFIWLILVNNDRPFTTQWNMAVPNK